MQKNAPIGVLDSGVGGLSVLKCLHAALPQEDFIYVGDTAAHPMDLAVKLRFVVSSARSSTIWLGAA